jgi:hypothetical protein
MKPTPTSYDWSERVVNKIAPIAAKTIVSAPFGRSVIDPEQLYGDDCNKGPDEGDQRRKPIGYLDEQVSAARGGGRRCSYQ